jgi:hypothetical protein
MGENYEPPASGRELAARLQEALGIAGPVAKIVVVADCKDAARVYVERLVRRDSEVSGLAGALAAVDRPLVVEVGRIAVGERGDVRVEE